MQKPKRNAMQSFANQQIHKNTEPTALGVHTWQTGTNTGIDTVPFFLTQAKRGAKGKL